MRLPGMTRAPEAVLQEARKLVRAGSLGPVLFCRMSHAGLLPFVEFVLDSRICVAEVSTFTEGAVFVGTRATLAVSRSGCRLFTCDSSERPMRFQARGAGRGVDAAI